MCCPLLQPEPEAAVAAPEPGWLPACRKLSPNSCSPTACLSACVPQQERDTRTHRAPLRVLERSIFSDRLVFVRAMHEAGRMEDWEVQMYDSW